VMKKKSTKTKLLKKPPLNRESLRAVDRAFIHNIMFELGIIPIEDWRLDMRVPLKQLTQEEQRVAKRKFRKLWRKYLKRSINGTNGGGNEFLRESRVKHVKKRFGLGKKIPSHSEKAERKRIVFESVWNDRIAALIHGFENPSNPGEKKDDLTKE